MGVQKLDIEFEDDDEIAEREAAERKKNEVVPDVDIDFGASDSDAPAEGEAPVAKKKKKKKREDDGSAAAPAPATAAAPAAAPAQELDIEVEDQLQNNIQEVAQEGIQEAPQAQVIQQQVVTQPAQQTIIQTVMQPVSIGQGYQLGDELRKAEATNQILRVEIEAKIQVAVAEKMTEVIAEHAQGTKVLEHKISKILSQIAAKAPAMKKEVMMIKKYLAEHAQVKKSGSSSSSEKTEQIKKAPSGASQVKKKAS